MTDNFHLMIACFVFLMLAIGIGLTILEFSRGDPPQQEADDEYNPQARDGEAQKRT